MSLVRELKKESTQISTLEELTGAFESIASIRIQQTKNKTLLAKEFFADLWSVYTQLRTDEKDRITREEYFSKNRSGEVAVIITSKGKLSGEIDHKIIDTLLEDINPSETDIVSIGAHGKALLKEKGVSVVKEYDIPEQEEGGYVVDVSSIIDFVHKYAKVTVYYETYISLSQQEVKKTELLLAIKALSEEERDFEIEGGGKKKIISKRGYIFEPSHKEVVEYMENIMKKVALSQMLLESSLAQHASRFKAMRAASERAGEMREDIKKKLNRAKRAEKDARMREIISFQFLD